MTPPLPAETSQRLQEVLAGWQAWNCPPLTIPTVAGQLDGYTNLSYLVTDGNRQWVVRLNSENDDAGISRSNEISAITAAHQAGISPGVVFSSRDSLVVEYLSGEKPTLANIAEIGARFADIHSLNVSIQSLDLQKYLRAYYKQVPGNHDLDLCYEKMTGLQPPTACSQVFCHQDLTLDNMINTRNGIAVIDWEYAAMSDPAYDLAVFSYSHELNEAQFSRLLKNYHRQEIDLPSRVRYFEKIYALIEILWWLARGTNPVDKIKRLTILLGQR